jgi:hypothetical protein
LDNGAQSAYLFSGYTCPCIYHIYYQFIDSSCRFCLLNHTHDRFGHDPQFFLARLFPFTRANVSEIISEPKLFALKTEKLKAFSIFESKMAARSAFLCQPVGFVPQKYV